mmetsp:Transcript_101809/g.263118  ORF Transcript_101809/g.263118 Transcript_101809/m.263118 type:complete len:204 (+) Transcript_101809:49-660(+)
MRAHGPAARHFDGGYTCSCLTCDGRGSTWMLFRTWPPCEMASIRISCLESVRSMKPYWSSSPCLSGMPSEVMPPPPPEMTTAEGRTGLSSASGAQTFWKCWCPVTKRSMPCLSARSFQSASPQCGGMCVTTICQSAVEMARLRSIHSFSASHRRSNQAGQSSIDNGPIAPQLAPDGLCLDPHMLCPDTSSGGNAVNLLESTKR